MISPEKKWWASVNIAIAVFAVVGIATHIVLRNVNLSAIADYPLIAVLVIGGAPLVWTLLMSALRREFGADLLAGVSIVTSIILGEYLAGAIVVLMLSGGESLEEYAVGRASAVLTALATRMPSIAHRTIDGKMDDIAVEDICVDDHIVIFPNEIVPVDGVVIQGNGRMDESFLTGEPFEVQKTVGSEVISGAINKDHAITIQASALAKDSRYARIMQVMEGAQQSKPRIRRLADRLGAWYTPLAVTFAVLAWVFSGDPVRFLAVLVVATPCPLLISIPVALLGAVSLAAKRSIVVRDTSVLEQIRLCRTLILDKTGTLTVGRPEMTEIKVAEGFEENDVVQLAASLEQFSKHPLAEAILRAAKDRKLDPLEVATMAEHPGKGLVGTVDSKSITLTSRAKLKQKNHADLESLPPTESGLESVILIDGRYAATLVFHDEPRVDGAAYIDHLKPAHDINRVMIVSGDRKSEVDYLAARVGITETYHDQSPEEKVAIVEEQEKSARVCFIGDGINDAPALMIATAGIAMGPGSDITSEAAGAVILEPSLRKVDELFHISSRFRTIALQSAVGGMALSVVGMGFAAFGFLTPVMGAVAQEIIDLVSIANALRVGVRKKELSDF